jgi:hypothetical protein
MKYAGKGVANNVQTTTLITGGNRGLALKSRVNSWPPAMRFGELDVLVNNAGISGGRIRPREATADQMRGSTSGGGKTP